MFGGLSREMSSKGLLGWRFARILSTILNKKRGMFPLRYFSPFLDGIPCSDVTAQFAGRFYIFNPLFIRKMVHLITNLMTYCRKLIKL